jgi:PAS fold
VCSNGTLLTVQKVRVTLLLCNAHNAQLLAALCSSTAMLQCFNHITQPLLLLRMPLLQMYTYYAHVVHVILQFTAQFVYIDLQLLLQLYSQLIPQLHLLEHVQTAFGSRIHPDDEKAVMARFADSVNGLYGGMFDSTYRVVHKSGMTLILHSHGETSVNSDGTER